MLKITVEGNKEEVRDARKNRGLKLNMLLRRINKYEQREDKNKRNISA